MHSKTLNIMDGLLLALMAYLTHLTIFAWYYPLKEHGVTPELQLKIIIILGLMVFWLIRLENGEKAFLLAWRYNSIVALFVGLAVMSLLWTVTPPATVYSAFLLLFVTLIAAYLGMRLSAHNLVSFLALTIGVFALVSFFLGVFFPDLAIHSEWPYQGLWHGVFWHKIYLGATMALGYIAYLVILFSGSQHYNRIQKVLAAVMIMICVGLAIKSDSASGLVVFAIQTVLFILALAWLALGRLIPRRVYWWMGGVAALAVLFLLANLGFVFGLFNRSANMTGRLPLWGHLLTDYISKRPLLGHGVGAFWQQAGITETIQAIVGWGYPVRVSDNGYLDVLLGLGIIGLLLLLGMLALGFWRALRSAIQAHDLVSFFPFFVLVHIVFINISLSYFFEGEIFIWFLLVVILFMYVPRRDQQAVKAATVGQIENLPAE